MKANLDLVRQQESQLLVPTYERVPVLFERGDGVYLFDSEGRRYVDFLSGIGLRAVEHPSGAGAHVPVDALGRTEVPGVWAAGNVSDPFAQVGAAAAAGAFAAAQINADLVTEETGMAVQALRASA